MGPFLISTLKHQINVHTGLPTFKKNQELFNSKNHKKIILVKEKLKHQSCLIYNFLQKLVLTLEIFEFSRQKQARSQ